MTIFVRCMSAYVQVGESGVDVVLGSPDVLHSLDVLLGLLQPVTELLLVLLVQTVVVVGCLQVVAHVLEMGCRVQVSNLVFYAQSTITVISG